MYASSQRGHSALIWSPGFSTDTWTSLNASFWHSGFWQYFSIRLTPCLAMRQRATTHRVICTKISRKSQYAVRNTRLSRQPGGGVEGAFALLYRFFEFMLAETAVVIAGVGGVVSFKSGQGAGVADLAEGPDGPVSLSETVVCGLDVLY